MVFIQDVEIIAIDPNNFYTTSEDDEEEEEEGSGEEEEEEESDNHVVSVSMATTMPTVNAAHQNGILQSGIELATTHFPLYHHNSTAFDMHPSSSDDFDIITLNIDDDDFPIDAQDDDILFRTTLNDHQFDLATYIGGGSAGSECSSLLLTPVKEAAASTASTLNMRQQYLLSNAPINAEPINKISSMRSAAVNTSTAHVKVTKTPASNRRKRKNLSCEFILESDDTSDTDSNNRCKSVISNKIHQMIDDRKETCKRKSMPDTEDPNWDQVSVKRITPTIKSSKSRKDLIAQLKASNTKVPVKHANGQGKSLRNLLKQQLLSDRPMNTKKLLKTTSSPALSSIPNLVERMQVAQVTQAPDHRIGVGRGKDINITAKYYNRSESSDDDEDSIVEQVKSNKTLRYDQIYTDSDDSDMEIDVSSVPTTLPQLNIEQKTFCLPDKERTIAEAEKCIEDNECKKKTQLNGNVDKKLNNNKEMPSIEKNKVIESPLLLKKIEKTDKTDKTKLLNCGNSKSTLLCSQNLDSTEFAKALVVNAKTKAIPRSKSVTAASSIAAAKQKKLEQQKRLIKSNILLQNPAKFKLLSTSSAPLRSTTKPAHDNNVPETAAKSNDAIKPCGTVKEKSPEKDSKPISSKQIKIEPENHLKVENETIDETKNANQETAPSQEDIKLDIAEISVQTTAAADDHQKNEANAKRKLNIQEYLQRKSLSSTDPNGIKGKQHANGIKMERSDAKNNSNNANGADDGSNASCLAVNSMYEEIVIVSIGCNTDISIPKTQLLTNIQTSVAEANAKISSNSLISSIQNVLLKKSQCNGAADHSTAKKERKNSDPRKTKSSKSNENDKDDDGEDEVEVHGENKVIMHLRKDRVRPMRKAVSIQTEPYFQFLPLRKLAPIASRKSVAPSAKTIKRTNSLPRDNHHFMQSNGGGDGSGRNRAHSKSISRNRLTKSNHYSDHDEEMINKTQRPSRHSQFMEQSKRHKYRSYRRHYSNGHRESSRYSTHRYSSRNRTLSSSSNSSSVSEVSVASSLSSSSSSSSSASSTTSKSSSSSQSSSRSPRSLNSYGKF